MKTFSFVVCLLFAAILVQGQTPKTAPSNSATPSAADVELKERRARARSLLVSLSSDARTFRDQTLRARSLARIADALWKVDAEQGRLLFRKAWDAAEVADEESDKKLKEEIARQQARTGGGGYAVNTPPNIRREVLRLAARHDRTLGEEFLEKLKLQKIEAATSATDKRSPHNLSDALSQRLDVARELMQAGEVDRALQFADPALSQVTMETMNFLSWAREKNPAAADARYAALLASSANNPQADANTVSLLSSYIFTPHLLMTFSGNGTSSSQSASKIVPADVAAELRNAFFQLAASILLRPLPAPGQTDQTTSGLDGKYLVIKRLLPFFEQSAPPAMVETLRGHMNALQTVVSDNARRYDEEQLNRGLRPEPPGTDREQSLLDRIDRAKTSAERDSLYMQLAWRASGKGDMRARDFVSKIEDSEIRKQAQLYMDASLTMYFVGKKQADQALELVQKGELNHLVKAWALTECAKIFFKAGDRDKALELVDQAANEARRIDVSDPSLPRALVAVAYALNAIDRDKVWDATFDAVKAANSAEGFTGEDGEVVAAFQSKGQNSVHTSDVPEFDLDGLFRDLATQDYDRAVELARGFQAEGPRAVATIAIARAILEPKPQKSTQNTK
jgi:tetratricopeptide (TPR) repeat protein